MHDRERRVIAHVTENDIIDGLRALGLDGSSPVLVHASLSSFGQVEGGAASVCRALAMVCGTVVMPAGSWDLTGLPMAPPGLERPHNAYSTAPSWDEFDAALAAATPFRDDLPIDRELGVIPETMRRHLEPLRSAHPLFAFIARGACARQVLDAQRLDWPLGPIEALADLDGDVLLLGVTHTANTTIHLAEQRLGRSRFWRYAKSAEGVWMELPNIPGESDAFDDIEPELADCREVRIGDCRARRVAVRDVLATATRLIRSDPAALLGNDPDPTSRTAAALRQRLATLAGEAE